MTWFIGEIREKQLSSECIHCGKSIDAGNEKFCSKNCENLHMKHLKEKMLDSVKNDPSHTTKISDSE